MPASQLVTDRIVSHGLCAPTGASVAEVVAGELAMQGQDLPGAIASIALRARTSAQQVIEAFDAGEIVRAYPMRGTVFVVAAADALWLGELCNAQQVRAQIKRRGALGLTDAHFETGLEVLAGAARDGVSRADLLALLQEAGIETRGGRGYHMLSHFVQVGLATYGRWRDGDNEVHLASEWLPAGSTLEGRFGGDRVSAAAELLERYFASHGPASIRDAAWWSKLPLKLLREAAEHLGDSIEVIDTDGEPLYQRAGLADEVAAAGESARAARLLPGFDELVLGYPDRSYIAGEHVDKLVPGGNGVFRHTAVASGAIQGTWKRAGKPGRRSLELTPWRTISKTRMRQFERAFDAFPFATD